MESKTTTSFTKFKIEPQKPASSCSQDLVGTDQANYPFVQDIRSPIYLSKGLSNSVYFAKVQKVQSKIDRNVFDMGSKMLNRMPKEIPDPKFFYQRFYYYSKFDDGIKMDYESKHIILL